MSSSLDTRAAAPPTGSRPGRRTDLVVGWAAAAVLAALYATEAIRRHELFRTGGYDLGIFEQAVKAYAHLRAPVVPLKGFDLLGDHFHPLLAVFAPFYRLFPSAITMLVLQSVVLALGVVPIASWAVRRLGTGAGIVVACCSGLSWGVQRAAGFDVHEVALAVPLLAWSLVALGQRRWRAAVLWGLPLVLVKEDLGVTLAVIGLLVAVLGRREGRVALGFGTAAFGLVATAVEITVLIPAFAPDGAYRFLGKEHAGGAGQGHLAALWQLVEHTVTPATKWHTLLLLLAVTAFTALGSPLVLAVLPTLAWRFTSADTAYWGTHYHYSAVLMPVVFAAMVDALGRRRTPRRLRWGALAGSLAVTAVLVPGLPLWQLTSPATWRTDPRGAALDRLVARIPAGADVAASNQLAAHLVARYEVSLFPRLSGALPTAPWVLDDVADPAGYPALPAQEAADLAAAERAGYRRVATDTGIVLLHRAG